MFSIIQSIKTAFSGLLANKVRSFLTMLGIIIGVGAVIIIMSVGGGAQSLILSQVESLGSNLVGVMPGKSEKDGPPTAVMGITITTLKYEDLKALKDKRNVPNLVDAVGYYKGISTVSWKNNNYDTNISGSTVGYLAVEGGEVEDGRFFSLEEETNLSKAAVLGSTVKKELFGDSEAVGQRIKINRHIFEVIGVMKERGTVAFQDYDDQIFIPIRTMQKLISGVDHLSLIRIKIDDESNIDRAILDIKTTLRQTHGIEDQSGDSDDFTIMNAVDALEMITSITSALKYFLAAMAALSLLVGGIGIMNIMLVSVSERTREIGLRKAVGAKNGNIISQFLLEASVVTIFGGLIGIAVGALISFLISLGVNAFGYDWDFVLSPFSIVLAVSVAAGVGIVFGIYPAKKAGSLEPIEALRYE
jgi:ABC-type antimicrobial peptide transport system permease subunit